MTAIRLFRFGGIIPGAILLLTLWSGMGYGQTSDEILVWTARQMNIAPPPSAPQIYWVDRTELRKAFVENNHLAYLQWESDLGSSEAMKILSIYLDEIVGMFVIHANTIYVGTFLEPCRQQAVLAHEFVHYLQQITRGLITGKGDDVDNLRLAREGEAYQIEQHYMQAFCPSQPAPPAFATEDSASR